ncbi:unnamed protein product [Notodromas monacha]|uniref:Uncharacterized protein n=1 Tax=Notodromas monacha TaxID=399045 RepID=A0A7R9C155_9CRUS|nr:unnamed protein product [Notodromas monacha]CAG0924112.1 unnamed protein product [Notodromas monacha]
MFDPAIPKSTIASFFVAIFAIALPAVFASSSEFTKPAHHSVEELVLTNEVASAIGDEEEESLPTCPRGAACAHVQANSRGINVVEYCQCKKGKLAKFLGLTTFHDCPLTWDPEDGKSITQGSNQYKFLRPVVSSQNLLTTQSKNWYSRTKSLQPSATRRRKACQPVQEEQHVLTFKPTAEESTS